MVENATGVLSFGAGVNSIALAILLVNEGWRGHIVFCDTECEWPDTYCYMTMFEHDWLRPRGLSITRLCRAPWQAKYDGGLIDYCKYAHVVPLQYPRWCTNEWKVDPQTRWRIANSVADAPMLGIAADEDHRMPAAIRPLVDRGIDRAGCERIITEAGLPLPRKSGCYICPFQRQSQWRELWQRYPQLFARAVALETNARHIDGRRVTLGMKPLVDLQHAFELQMPLFDDTEQQEYRPCICQL